MTGLELLRDEVFRWHIALSTYPVGLITKWALGLVFLISGYVKLRDPARAALAIVDFGVARRARAATGFGLGLAEVLLGLVTIAFASRLVLLVSALLLWMFLTLILRSLRRGEDFACYCFGDTDGHLSVWTAARTALIAILATNLLLGYDASRVSSTDEFSAAAAAVAVVGGLFLAGRVPRLITWNSSARRMT